MGYITLSQELGGPYLKAFLESPLKIIYILVAGQEMRTVGLLLVSTKPFWGLDLNLWWALPEMVIMGARMECGHMDLHLTLLAYHRS